VGKTRTQAVGRRKLDDLVVSGELGSDICFGGSLTPRVGAMTPLWLGNRLYLIPPTSGAQSPSLTGLPMFSPIENGLFQPFIIVSYSSPEDSLRRTRLP